MDEDYAKIEQIFSQAADLPDGKERAAFLDSVCGQDRQLRAAVERLLKHDVSDSFLESPVVAGAPVASPTAEQVGTMIGPYKLIEEIGEGGMGNVFMALQKTPIRRKVALKLIKPGMDSKHVVSRFEAERQALAMMDHPSIARVFDGGTTQSGRPYFVMELVQGLPLTEYCDRYRLPLKERLELFIQVCLGVQHAHLKGVIHRDLKPSNIMVTLYDGAPVPKVIDFGIAKATSGQLSDATLVTNYAQMIGTPLYMSPEQAALSSQDVDTRSDIYSLGVLLYELLTGTTPFGRERVDDVSIEELGRIIREEVPPKPSTRLGALGSALDTVDENRHATLLLSQQVKGELDWIVMKALEKDRTRRYESASELAKDVQHYLNDEPVEACPPSKVYLLRRTVRRHKKSLAFATAVVLVLVLGLVGTTWQALNAIDARDLADQRLVDVEQQREIADQRKESLRQSLYAADIPIAYQLWQVGNRRWALAKLEELRPKGSEVDLRGFEWHYLWRLCHSGRQMLPEHAGDVYGVAISPDGRLLASASQDETAQVWNVATGELATTLSEHAGELNCVAFSPDGRLLAIGADNRSVLVRDTSSWELKATLTGHNDNVLSVAFSPDGRLLASGAWNDQVRLWDATNFTPKATFDSHAIDVESVAFSPDSKTLAAGCWSDNTARLWDTASGKERMVLRGHAEQVYCVTFSHDGRLLASGDKDYVVKLWDTASGEMLHTLSGHSEWVRGVAFSPDNRTLASCSNDGFVRFWDTTTGELIRTIRGNSDRLRAVVWSPDGKTLATAGSHGMVRLWDATGSQECKTLVPADRREEAFSFGVAGGLLTSASTGDVTDFTLWDAAGNESATFTQQEGKRIEAIALAPDDRTFATGADDGTVDLCDLATGQIRVTLGRHADRIDKLAFTVDGRTLAAEGRDDAVKLWDVAGEKELMTFSSAGFDVALAPDGGTLATGGEDGNVDLWNTTNGELLRTLQGHDDKIGALAFSADGTMLASGSDDHTIRLWDPATGQPQGALLGHADGISALAISPDGKTLASGSSDGTLRLWNIASRRELLILGQDSFVCRLQFSPDGTSLVGIRSSGTGRGVFLWSAAPLESSVPAASPLVPR